MLFTLCPHCMPYFSTWNASKSSLNLKKVIGQRVWTIRNTTDFVNFQCLQYWRGFWYFFWLLNKFWLVEKQTINAADLIWKFCEFSRSVNSYISWKVPGINSIIYCTTDPILRGFPVVGLVVVSLDGNVWVHMCKKAHNRAWSKLRGTRMACNIYSFDLLVEFLQWMGDDFIDTRSQCNSQLLALLGGNCDWQFTILIIRACSEKVERFIAENIYFGFRSDALIYSFCYNRGE